MNVGRRRRCRVGAGLVLLAASLDASVPLSAQVTGDSGTAAKPTSEPSVTAGRPGFLIRTTDGKFQFRAEKFKGPVGLERLQSQTDLMFIERA